VKGKNIIIVGNTGSGKSSFMEANMPTEDIIYVGLHGHYFQPKDNWKEVIIKPEPEELEALLSELILDVEQREELKIQENTFTVILDELGTIAHYDNLYSICSKINTLLIKGPAVGISIMISSQSNNFILKYLNLESIHTKVALRCSDYASKILIGNDLASKIKERYGIAYISYNNEPAERVEV
jgi:hypothetical protein